MWHKSLACEYNTGTGQVTYVHAKVKIIAIGDGYLMNGAFIAATAQCSGDQLNRHILAIPEHATSVGVLLYASPGYYAAHVNAGLIDTN
jgi:hypothetical protein